jgi:predicted nuclease with TOPRIM domain
MSSIQLPGEDGSTVVTIKYKVNQIGKDAQEALNNDLDLATLSILELSTVVSNTRHGLEDNMSHLQNTFGEHKTRLENLEREQNSLIETVGHWETLFNTLADRVAVLENRLEEGLT